MPERKKPVKPKPTPPEKDVRELQNSEQTVDDFLRDLDRAATNDSKRKLADPSRPDRASTKT